MNVKRLRAVKAMILKHGKHYDQGTFGDTSHSKLGNSDEIATLKQLTHNKCRTVACIGG